SPLRVASHLVQATLRADLGQRLRLRDGGRGLPELRTARSARRLRDLDLVPLPPVRRLQQAPRADAVSLRVHVPAALLTLRDPRRFGDARQGVLLLGRARLDDRKANGRATAPPAGPPAGGRRAGGRRAGPVASDAHAEDVAVTALHLIKTGEGATWALRQIGVLRAAGVDVVAALPSARGVCAAEYRKLGVAVVEVDLDFTVYAPWKLAPAIVRCRRLVERIRPDVIHSHFV